MDPLSVIASVAGIITAASEAIKVLGPYVTATKDAPKIASQMLSEILAVKTIVAALEQFAANLGPSRVQYASLVQVDQLLAVLTDGVLVFSELDALLQTLAPTDTGGSRARLLSSMQWVRKKGALTTLCTRLQAFKLSINCILSILQSDSQLRAEDHQKQLLSSMDTLLKNNEALAQIFLGPDPLAPITWSRRTSIQSVAPDSETARNRRSLFALSFEKDLIASRVYRRIRRDTMDFSMRSSVARSNGWSIFSGLSLSDISEISVLALPILPSDITNPQHYVEGSEFRRARELSHLPASVYRSSAFHECVELEAQLVQLTQCLFKEVLERERSSDILATLVSVFRRGAPLLQLYNQLDDAYQDRWKPLVSQTPSPSSAKLAIVEFIQACVTRQGISISDCFTVTDLMDDDATSHMKVVRLVRQITAELVNAKVIKTVDIDSLPQMQTPKGPLPPSPQMLAIEELVRDERTYVARLGCFTLLSDHILRYHEVFLLGDINVAVNDLFSSCSRKLIDAQLRFLIQLEALALRPYELFHLPWLQLFRNWANLAKDSYARFSSGEKNVKRALQNFLAFQALSTPTNVPEELSNLAGDVIGCLSMPGQRLRKYRAFLKELAGYDDAMFVKEATDTVDEVIELSHAAMDDVVREDAKVALLSSLDTADQSNVRQYGKLLLYEEIASIDTDIDGPRTDPLALLYLFEKAVLHVTLAKKGGGSRLADDSRLRLSIVRIIRGEDLCLVSTRGAKDRWLEDDWHVLGGGFEMYTLSGKIIVHLAVDSRHNEWVEALIQVRDECRKTKKSSAIQNYKLAAVGGMGSGREKFTHQFLLPHSPEEYRSEDWKSPDIETESRRLIVANETYNLEILGPSVQEAYSAMRYAYMTMCDGFLLIYSVADRHSFEDILTLHQQILRAKDKDSFPMIVVSNDSETSRSWEVTVEEGRAMANKMGCPFVEADAWTGYNVEEAFGCLAREISRYQMGF